MLKKIVGALMEEYSTSEILSALGQCLEAQYIFIQDDTVNHYEKLRDIVFEAYIASQKVNPAK